ncbi:hypothetical protein TNCV_3925811 [Trichonephila clavipes]|nr:hypothetical protein TNCV_3925811 [Trichonephila clavipes]
MTIDRHSIWFTRDGDIDILSRDGHLSRKNQWQSSLRQRVPVEESTHLDGVVACDDASVLHLYVGWGVRELAFGVRSGALVPLELSAHLQLEPPRVLDGREAAHHGHVMTDGRTEVTSATEGTKNVKYFIIKQNKKAAKHSILTQHYCSSRHNATWIEDRTVETLTVGVLQLP